MVCIALFSCNSKSEKNVELVIIDTIEKVDIAEKIDSNLSSIDSSAVIAYDTETADATIEKLEKTFGKQWDFCDCIHKTDSIQRAIESAGDMSDDDFDNLMTRFEDIDQHCKTLIASPNTTPEERKRHERKVKKCLNSRR